MDTYANGAAYPTACGGAATIAAPHRGPEDLCDPYSGYDMAVNAETCTYRDGDDLVSMLSVHTLVCPLIRAELRGESAVRLIVYYHAQTRLGLAAYEIVMRDATAVRDRLGLRPFVRHTLKLADTAAHLNDPSIREMYLHEIIRHLRGPIAGRRLQESAEFAIARIV